MFDFFYLFFADAAAQAEEAAEKRTNAVSFGDNATAATADMSEAVARFSDKHLKGCGDLKEFLGKAEAAARAASGELSVAAAEALKEVKMDSGGGFKASFVHGDAKTCWHMYGKMSMDQTFMFPTSSITHLVINQQIHCFLVVGKPSG